MDSPIEQITTTTPPPPPAPLKRPRPVSLAEEMDDEPPAKRLCF